MDVIRGIADKAGGSSPADRSPAEYYRPLLNAIASLEPDHERRVRREIYDRVRGLLFSRMCSASPPLSGDDIRQARLVLEHAIEQVEAMVLAPEWPARRLQYRQSPSPPAAAIEELDEQQPDAGVEPVSAVVSAPQPLLSFPPDPVEPSRPRPPRRTVLIALTSTAVGAAAILVGVLIHFATSKPDVAVTAPVDVTTAGPEDRVRSAAVEPAPVDPPAVAAEPGPQEVRQGDRPAEEPGGPVDPARSIADLTAAVRAQPKSAKPYFERGEAWAGRGEGDRAIADFDEAVQRDPNHALAYTARAAAHRRKGETDRAIADLTRAIGLATMESGRLAAGQLVRAYDSRAGLYDAKGLYDREVADLNKAIEICLADPRAADDIRNERGAAGPAFLASAYQRRAKAYLRGGRTEQAIADFRRALSIDPGMQEAKAALAGLGATP